MTSSEPLETTAYRSNSDKAGRIRQLVAECLRRRAAGEQLDDRELLAGHDDLLPELEVELRRLRLIALQRPEAGETVDISSSDVAGSRNDSHGAPFAADESEGRERHGVVGGDDLPNRSPSGSRGLRIRCPHCHEPQEIVADADLVDIPCRSCGNRFSLAGADRSDGAALGQIGHFELLERLGMGGFGTVWKARDTKLGRTVAVKIPRKGKLDAGEVEEFLREARIAAQLKHPHIVSVHEIGRDGETVYIVSDFVRGWSLSDWRRKRRLTLAESADLCATISTALHFAHEAGVVHRDLKPQNVMIDDQGRPHIMDFGLAKREAEDVTMTAEGDILGTPAYMSPEQARGDAKHADRRTDVYAIGVMLFELLTDELPFRGNVLNLIRQTIHDEPPRPSRLNGTIPRDLETICLKCLEKEPARRYSTAQDIADELARYRRGEPVQARPLSTASRAWRWCRRHPLVPSLSASLALVVLLVYAVGWVYFQRACNQLDRELTARALSADKFMAASVAETAGRDFALRFEAVERAARDPALVELLERLDTEPSLLEARRQLNDPSSTPETLAALKPLLRESPIQQEIQAWTISQKTRQGITGFAWFVTGADGLQLSRDPLEGGETIGQNYAWRSYFHGGDHDEAVDWRPRSDQRVSGTRLSAVFVSQFTNQWTVVVSAPVEREGKFLGVVALMIELGKFAELPGNENSVGEGDQVDRFAVLVDSRPGNPGQILQHPVYLWPEMEHRRTLLDRSSEPQYAVVLDESLQRDDYRDPFAHEHAEYAQRWLVAGAPLKVRGQDTGLRVLVQESYDELIGSALVHLKRTVLWLSLASLALVAALVIPIWAVVMRVIR